MRTLLALALLLGAPLQDPANDTPQPAPVVVVEERPSVDKVKDAIDEAIERNNARTLERIIRALEGIEPVSAPVEVADDTFPTPVPPDEQLPPQLPSQPGYGVAVITSNAAGGWVILKFGAATGFVGIEPIVLEDGRVAIWEGPPGGYAVLFFETGKLQPKIFNVTIGVVEPAPPGPSDPPPTDPPVDPEKKTTRVTYVFEKDQKNTPRPVAAALQRINASGSGVVATEFEEDTTDGDGQVPDQYKVALEAARKAGLPALVVQSGDTVLRVVKDPTTEAAVLEALK